ncbi:MAG: hypothetical protein ACI32C_01600, partial [Candidatus Enteromonas sp.]
HQILSFPGKIKSLPELEDSRELETSQPVRANKLKKTRTMFFISFFRYFIKSKEKDENISIKKSKEPIIAQDKGNAEFSATHALFIHR